MLYTVYALPILETGRIMAVVNEATDVRAKIYERQMHLVRFEVEGDNELDARMKAEVEQERLRHLLSESKMQFGHDGIVWPCEY